MNPQKGKASMKRYQSSKTTSSHHALSSLQLEEVADRVRAMRKQEETTYLYRQFLPSSMIGCNGGKAPGVRTTNVVWREKICQWSYNVVDHFDLSREVVAVSLSLFDRYFATLGNTCNGNMALLASLTTLHIAIKLHDTKKIKLCTLANLSRGQFNSSDIEQMEWTILSALQWKLHPPTPYAFVEHFLQFLPPEINISIRKGLNEVSKYLTELAVCDAYFVDCSHSSTIAFAAILNVMEDMNYSRFSGGLRESFLTSLACYVDMHHRSAGVVDARQRLRKMLAVSSTVYSGTNNVSSSNVHVITPNQATPTSSGFENYYGGSSSFGAMSFAERSMSSAGSVLSSYHNTVLKTSRSRASSIDTSKSGSCRYAQSPRRSFFASVSPLTSRAAMSTSLIEAGVQ